MKYIFFSDVHGNDIALRKLLEEEKPGSDKKFIFCGDVCGYYYGEKECVRLLESIGDLTAVRGNHDQYYIDAYDDTETTEKLIKKYGSSYKCKDDSVLEYVQRLPLRAEITIGGRLFSVVHGTPEDPLEGRIYPDSGIDRKEKGFACISGHTHYAMLRREGDILWINPGSLGQPRDGKGFSYCSIDDGTMEIAFRHFEIDTKPIIEAARKNDPENKYLEEIFYRRS